MKEILTLNVKALNPDSKIIEFSGEFDKAGLSEIKSNLDDLVKKFSGSNLIFDFSHLDFINSEGIGYLIEIHSFLINREKRLIIVGLKNNVKDVFEAVGIDEIVDIYKSINDIN